MPSDPVPVDPVPAPAEAYLAERARQALATDPRVADLDVTVTLVHDDAYVRGSASSQEQAAAIVDVLAEQLPDHQVHGEVVVVDADEPRDAEELA
jgi:hypothetical protein